MCSEIKLKDFRSRVDKILSPVVMSVSHTCNFWVNESNSHQSSWFTGSPTPCELKQCKCRCGLVGPMGWYTIVEDMCDDRLRTLAQSCLHHTICAGLYSSTSIWSELPGIQGMFDFVNNSIYSGLRRPLEDYVKDYIENIASLDALEKLWLDHLFISVLHSPPWQADSDDEISNLQTQAASVQNQNR